MPGQSFVADDQVGCHSSVVQQLVDPPVALLNGLRMSKWLGKHMQPLAAVFALSHNHASLYLPVEKSRAPCLNVRFNELNGWGVLGLLACVASAQPSLRGLWRFATIVCMRVSSIRLSRPIVGCLCHLLHMQRNVRSSRSR